MKKKIVLIFISLFILNAPMFALAGGKNDDNVTAQPLTCTYGSSKNAYRFMLIQNSDGSHETKYILLEGNVWADVSNIDLNDQRWISNHVKINLENDVLTSCPRSVDRNALGHLTFHSDTNGSFKLGSNSVNYSITEKKEQDEEAGIDTNQVYDNVTAKTSCSGDNRYIYNCYYKNIVNICFNEKELAFEYANSNSDSQMQYIGVQIDFTPSTFIERYHENNNTCPTIYADDQQGVMDTKLHLSMTNSVDGFAGTNPSNPGSSGAIPFNPVGPQSCESLLGDPSTQSTPAYYLTKAFHVVKYAAIVVLVVMSVVDFLTATTSNDNDAIIKAARKTITRFILCVIIFFLPYLIEFILKYLSDRAASLCGIG